MYMGTQQVTGSLCAGRPAYMRLDGEPWAQDLDGATPQQPLKVSFPVCGPHAQLGSVVSCR